MNIKDRRLQNFRRVLEEKNLKLKDISNLLDKAPSQISAFGGKNPTKGIGDQIAREIEKVLGLYHGYLDTPFGRDEHTNPVVLTQIGRRLPVMGSVSAGRWCEIGDGAPDIRDVEILDWVEAPGPVGPRAFVLQVEGVSMAPKLFEGDKIVVDPSLECRPGDLVVAKNHGTSPAMIRQLMQEGETRYLLALNPDWPNRIVPMNEAWIIYGRARWKISDL